METQTIELNSLSNGVLFKIGIIIATIVTIAFLIIGIILWLRTKPFKIYCIACEKEGWWYKCKENTGEGTETCRIAKEVEETIDKTMELIKESIKKVNEAMEILKNVAFEYKIPIPPSFNLPKIDSINIPNPFDVDCEIEIPIIKVKFNICEKISNVLDTVVDGLNDAINNSISIINSFMTQLESIPANLVEILNNVIANLRDFVQFIISFEFIILIQKNFIKSIENLEKYPILLIEVMIHNTLKKVFPNITFGDTIFALGFMITFITIVCVTGMFVFTFMILQLIIKLFI
jgi:hypothetical protein